MAELVKANPLYRNDKDHWEPTSDWERDHWDLLGIGKAFPPVWCQDCAYQIMDILTACQQANERPDHQPPSE